MTAVPDFLEKSVLLQATRARTWRALSAADLGSWFGVAIGTEPFAPGVRVQGRGTDPGYEDFVFDILIDRVEPERSLAWRWHPAVMDPAGDYSSEPMTLVVFELEALNEGTRLRIVESGFDHIPEPRRTQAFHMNNIGWEDVTRNIARYLAQASG